MSRKTKKNLALSLVKPVANSHLDKFKRLHTVEMEMDAELQKLGSITVFEQVGELVHLLCQMVENVTSLKLDGREKKELVIKKFLQIKPEYKEDEKDMKWVGVLIDTLCIGGCIAKVARSKEVVQEVKAVCGIFFGK